MTRSQHVREVLLEEDDEYRRLAEQHHDLDTRLNELLGYQYPSGADELEKATLKKRKLQVKDQMEQILRRHLTPHLGDAAPAFET